MKAKHFLSIAVLTFVATFAAASEFADEPCDPPRQPAQLVETLERAYRDRDPDLYATLFAQPSRHDVDFRFVLYEPTPGGETEWGYDEEVRIHRRMFRPETVPPTEDPVPRDLWVQSIAIRLEPLTEWRERFDLYRSEHNPTGPIDRHRFCATDAVYATAVEWVTAGRGTIAIAGEARFVVLEDRTLAVDAPDKFAFYIWEDLGPGGVASGATRR
jgi:hypothetical protein